MTKSLATKGCHSTIHLSIIVVHHHCTPFGFLCRASSSMFPPLTHLLHHSTFFPLSTMCTISFHLLALIDSPLTHLSTHAMHNHPCPLHHFRFHASLHWIIALNCYTIPCSLNHFRFMYHYIESLHSIATPFLVPSIISDFMHHYIASVHSIATPLHGPLHFHALPL